MVEITDLNIGDKFCGTHGFGDDGHVHDHHHYEVVGILKHSNSVIDKLILTDMKSVWEVHNPNEHQACDHHDHDNLQEHKCSNENNDDLYMSDEFMITSMLVKFKNLLGFVQLPRKVNENVIYKQL